MTMHNANVPFGTINLALEIICITQYLHNSVLIETSRGGTSIRSRWSPSNLNHTLTMTSLCGRR